MTLVWVAVALALAVFFFGGLPVLLSVLFHSKLLLAIIITVLAWKMGIIAWILNLRKG